MDKSIAIIEAAMVNAEDEKYRLQALADRIGENDEASERRKKLLQTKADAHEFVHDKLGASRRNLVDARNEYEVFPVPLDDEVTNDRYEQDVRNVQAPLRKAMAVAIELDGYTKVGDVDAMLSMHRGRVEETEE